TTECDASATQRYCMECIDVASAQYEATRGGSTGGMRGTDDQRMGCPRFPSRAHAYRGFTPAMEPRGAVADAHTSRTDPRAWMRPPVAGYPTGQWGVATYVR